MALEITVAILVSSGSRHSETIRWYISLFRLLSVCYIFGRVPLLSSALPALVRPGVCGPLPVRWSKESEGGLCVSWGRKYLSVQLDRLKKWLRRYGTQTRWPAESCQSRFDREQTQGALQEICNADASGTERHPQPFYTITGSHTRARARIGSTVLQSPMPSLVYYVRCHYRYYWYQRCSRRPV